MVLMLGCGFDFLLFFTFDRIVCDILKFTILGFKLKGG